MSTEQRIVAIIQARMGSSRLPGKVLLPIEGRPMLEWVVRRASRASLVNQVMVATTKDPADDPLAAWCAENQIACFRGSLYDVLDRFYQAARSVQADVVVRITADCPFLDPQLVDDTIRAFLASGVDFAANRLPPPWRRTYPIGLDTEVASFSALERAWREARETYEREHVMPYLYDSEGRFKTLLLQHETDCGSYRWTVDTPQDLEAARRIAAAFGGRDDFSWLDVLALVQQHPELSAINSGVAHKSYNDIDQRNR